MSRFLLPVIYLSFISLGLPDSLLGAAWPSMYGGLGVRVSMAGLISMVIAAGTVISSLLSHRLTRRLGVGGVMLCSVAATALALWGFSRSGAFWQLLLWAVPYGLGAGSVDAALNNYVALHYASRHMSWLHCMWGLGASLGPSIMGRALAGAAGWPGGYRAVALMQLVLTAMLAASLPLWHRDRRAGEEGQGRGAVTLSGLLQVPGVRSVMVSFFCYCAVEQTTGLWAASYLTFCRGIPAETAAGFSGLFFLGITAGRALSGFLTLRLSDRAMIRLGQGVIAAGIAVLVLPPGEGAALAGLVLAGLGCAPIYPCIIHSTPVLFGAGRSQAIIGLEMASAYVGTCLMPPLFGLLAAHVHIALLPWFLLTLLAGMTFSHRQALRQAAAG